MQIEKKRRRKRNTESGVLKNEGGDIVMQKRELEEGKRQNAARSLVGRGVFCFNTVVCLTA